MAADGIEPPTQRIDGITLINGPAQAERWEWEHA